MTRIPFRRAAAMAAGVFVLAACGGDDVTSDAVTTTTTTTEGSSTTTAAMTEGEGDAPAPAGTVIEIGVAGGVVEGGSRQKVALGDTVTLRVTSDVADEIHLHGYDVAVEVAAGETVDLTFDATIPGVFEVELEGARLPLVELEVS